MAIAFKSTGSGSGGEIISHIKYNTKAGRFFRVDRIEDGGQWTKDEVEITSDFIAVFDLENIEVGWIAFTETGPDFRLVRMGDDPGPRPTDKHQEGFRILVKLGEKCGGTDRVREFSATAGAVKGALSDLHTQYEHGLTQNPGLLPLVKLAKVTKRDTKYGTNFEPVFAIDRWVKRPADLVYSPRSNGGDAPSVAPEARSAPAATGSTRAAPPPAAKQPEMAEADDFG